MAKFIYFIIAVLAVQAVVARPKKTPPTQEGASTLELFVDNLDKIRKDVEASIKKIMPNSKDIDKALVDISKTFATTVEKGTKDLSEHTDKNRPLVETIVKEASDKITESIAYIKNLVGDDAGSKGEEMRKSVETNIRNIFNEGKKVEEALKPGMERAQENMEKVAHDFFEMMKVAGERLKADIDRALAEKAQKH